jgi:hypothetical protein
LRNTGIEGLVRKQEGKSPLEDLGVDASFYVKMDTKEIDMDLIYLAQDC